MKYDMVEDIACPACRGGLNLRGRNAGGPEVRAGTLQCRACRRSYPVVLGRPILLPPGAMSTWIPAIREALGGAKTRRLLRNPGKAGIDEALKGQWARWKDLRTGPRRWRVEPGLLRDGRMRLAGWTHSHEGKRIRVPGLEDARRPLPRLRKDREPIEEMVCQVLRLRPESVLDVASGGGWFVTRLLFHSRRRPKVISLERDLRCLWTLEYKFRSLKANNRAEAVGGDVRALPLGDNRMDVVTCANAFSEIAGLSAMMAEVHRVLRPGGHFIFSHSVAPVAFQPLSPADYRRLALATDLFVDANHLLKQAKQAGLVFEDKVSLRERNGLPCFAARFAKPAAPDVR